MIKPGSLSQFLRQMRCFCALSQICKFNSLKYAIANIYHVIAHFFAQETLFLTQKGTFLPKYLQKLRKSRQILIRDKIEYVPA